MASKDNAFILEGRAGSLANYPHARRVGDLFFISGISSRRPDNSHEGVEIADDGTVTRHIKAQTRAVIENVRVILKAAGLDLDALVDCTTFLTDMTNYAGYNAVYDEYFEAATGPSRTTVAVHQLPHPNLLIEMKFVASFSA